MLKMHAMNFQLQKSWAKAFALPFLFALIIFAPGLCQAAESQHFRFEPSSRRLLVSTSTMELGLELGAVVYVKDKSSGEVLVNTEPENYLPEVLSGFSRMNVWEVWRHRWENNLFNKFSLDTKAYTRPTANSPATFSQVSPGKGCLSFSRLLPDATGQDRLLIEVSVDEDAGDVILQATGLVENPGEELAAIDIPIVKLTTPAIILGSGARYTRRDVTKVDYPVKKNYGLFSPVMAVVEGEKAVLAVWSESTSFAPENIFLAHKPGYDHLVLHTEHDPKLADTRKIISSPWRLGTHGQWPKAARRWRETFEARTGAKPLWQNRAPWVRRIHAVYSRYLGRNEQKYAELASKAPPDKVLLLHWNGDRIVLFGDHTLAKGIAIPQKEALAIIKKYGWRMLLYHPYTLYYSKPGMNKRLQMLRDKKWLQEGYVFHPDYPGSASEWFSYWSDVTTSYDAKLNIIHPGSTKFKEYLTRNYRQWCATHGADGSYLDILGADFGGKFPAALQVVEGEDVNTGERNAIAKVTRELPNLPVMSEYQTPWLLPLAFYSWQGESHITQNAFAQTRLNHPLRVALTGSYSWLREGELTDPVSAALLGTLPELLLEGDAHEEKVNWHRARAQLFCEEELFNDLPSRWDPEALAYYRSKSGHWFKFKKLAADSYGYMEELPNGQERIRLLTGQQGGFPKKLARRAEPGDG